MHSVIDDDEAEVSVMDETLAHAHTHTLAMCLVITRKATRLFR